MGRVIDCSDFPGLHEQGVGNFNRVCVGCGADAWDTTPDGPEATCRALTVCDPLTEYESVLPTRVSDRRCARPALLLLFPRLTLAGRRRCESLTLACGDNDQCAYDGLELG